MKLLGQSSGLNTRTQNAVARIPVGSPMRKRAPDYVRHPGQFGEHILTGPLPSVTPSGPRHRDAERSRWVAAFQGTLPTGSGIFVANMGKSWHAVSKKTRIPYATVKKHARSMGYQSRHRLGKLTPAVPKPPRTNFSGLPTLREIRALTARESG
jgi:hypothetical protein